MFLLKFAETLAKIDDYKAQIKEFLERGNNNQEIVEALAELSFKTSEASVRRLIKRSSDLQEADERRRVYQEIKAQADPEGFTLGLDEATYTAPAGTPVDKLNVTEILTRRNLNPEDWEVKQILDNQWEANAGGGTKITLYQFKLWFARKVPIKLIYPACVDVRVPEPKPLKKKGDKPKLGLVLTDPQCPHINKELEILTLRWIDENQPDFIVIGGDLMNNGYIGRHRDDPKWDDKVQEAIQSSFNFLFGLRRHAPNAEITLLKGNHDDRIRNEQLERNERLYGVTAAQWPGEEAEEWVYSLNHLLHLNKLHINYVEPKGTYEFEQVEITNLLAARHGHKVVKDGAMKTAEELGVSVVLGHTHRQSMTRQTKWNAIKGTYEILTAIEAGCLCKVEGGLGYANGGSPNWQPGWVTVNTWPDNQFTWQHGIFEQSGVLRWNDQAYKI